jgi:pyridoxamine 5'-phosphate oxidase
VTHHDPIEWFSEWFDHAKAHSDIRIYDACTLCTLSEDGYPEGRIVLLKHFDEKGFVFFTNSHSVKGASLEATPRAALVFHWEQLNYQIRIQGDVELISSDESDRYFAGRSRGSQIGAWASLQSQEYSTREELEARYKDFERQYEDEVVPRPDHWNGYRILPRKIEFWIDGKYRLHDRVEFKLQSNGEWESRRLYP